MSGSSSIPAAARFLDECAAQLQRNPSDWEQALASATPPTDEEAKAIDKACRTDLQKEGECTHSQAAEGKEV
jgi:hypothetical protein